MNNEKKAMHDFWDDAPCGEVLSVIGKVWTYGLIRLNFPYAGLFIVN